MKMFDIWTFWALNELFRRLNNLKRWSSMITESGRNELGKQNFNSVCCYVLATEYEYRTGRKLRWELFPIIALYRAFSKGYVNFDIVENTLHEIEGSEKPFDLFNEVTEDVIDREVSEAFVHWIKKGCGTKEETIYKAATKIATIIELREIRPKVDNAQFEETYRAVMKSAAKYGNIPGFWDMLEEPTEDDPKKAIKALRDVARLRNRDRWSVYSHVVKCSVLGHMFDAGLFSYIVSLRKGYSEKEATKDFFIGTFHDVAEAYTGDIPSPVKDSIRGFRKKSEEFELKMLEKKFYPYFPEYVQKAIKSVMLEEEENRDRKAIGKIGDYLSAISEIHRQAVKGSRDKELYKALLGHKEKLYKFGAGETEISFYNEIERYCRKTMLADENEYYLAMIEMIFTSIARTSNFKKRKKMYKKMLIAGFQLMKSGTDFEKAKFKLLKKKSEKYL